MDRGGALVTRIQHFVLRICELPTSAPTLIHGPEQHDHLVPLEDISPERLTEPHCANRAAVVPNQRFEDLEAGAARRAHPAVHELPGTRRLIPWLQARDRPKVTAIFVPDRKALEQILN